MTLPRITQRRERGASNSSKSCRYDAAPLGGKSALGRLPALRIRESLLLAPSEARLPPLRLLCGVASALLLGTLSYADTPESLPRSVRLSVAGDVKPVLSGNQRPCGPDDLPDAGLRAVRRADGSLVAFANAEENYTLEGASLDELRKSCRSALRSGHDEDPAHYDDQTWIAATWSDNGKDVMAIGHHEYHGAEHDGRCLARNERQCRYGALIDLVSHDGGLSFVKAAPKPIAAVPEQQQTTQVRQTGFAQPSNIFAWDGFKYAFVHTTGGGAQKPGTCLMRAPDALDPKSWGLYDGSAFQPALFDPYVDDPATRGTCKAIWTNGLVWSVISLTNSHLLVALLTAVNLKTKGVYLATATSRDALHWSALLPVSGLSLNWGDKCPSTPFLHYPSLLDPLSKSRNFDSSSNDDLVIFFTKIEMADCKFTKQRELVRMSAKIDIVDK